MSMAAQSYQYPKFEEKFKEESKRLGFVEATWLRDEPSNSWKILYTHYKSVFEKEVDNSDALHPATQLRDLAREAEARDPKFVDSIAFKALCKTAQYFTGVNPLSKEVDERLLTFDVRKQMEEAKAWYGNSYTRTSMDSIVGMTDEIAQIREAVIIPLKVTRLSKPTRAVQLYGPPGTGKTLSVLGICGEIGDTIRQLQFKNKLSMTEPPVLFWPIDAADLLSGLPGITDLNVRTAFAKVDKMAEEYGNGCKSIVFLDEVEALALVRKTNPEMIPSVSALLKALNETAGKLQNTICFAATNLVWDLDDAYLSRFGAKIFVDLPNEFDCAQNILFNIWDHLYTKDFRNVLSLYRMRGYNANLQVQALSEPEKKLVKKLDAKAGDTDTLLKLIREEFQQVPCLQVEVTESKNNYLTVLTDLAKMKEVNKYMDPDVYYGKMDSKKDTEYKTKLNLADDRKGILESETNFYIDAALSFRGKIVRTSTYSADDIQAWNIAMALRICRDSIVKKLIESTRLNYEKYKNTFYGKGDQTLIKATEDELKIIQNQYLNRHIGIGSAHSIDVGVQRQGLTPPKSSWGYSNRDLATLVRVMFSGKVASLYNANNNFNQKTFGFKLEDIDAPLYTVRASTSEKDYPLFPYYKQFGTLPKMESAADSIAASLKVLNVKILQAGVRGASMGLFTRQLFIL